MYESVYASLHQCLKRLYFNSKDTAKKRAKKGRVGAGEHRINVAYLEKLWEKQGGRCYYSGIPLNYDKHEWRVSIERLDTDEGYVDGNVVLCCLECNGKTQWTPEKIEFVAGYVLPPQYDVEFQPLTRKTGRGKFGELMNSAYTASGIRRRRMRDSKAYSSEDIARRCAVEINTAFLIGLYNAQKGLCAYSGFPMQFGSHLKTDWAMSLERRDTKAGYTPENVRLICSEFNTSDQSFTIGNEYGSAGWTPLKFEYFRAHIRHSKGLISEDELQAIADAQIKYKSRAENNTEKPPPTYGPRRKQVFNAQFHESLLDMDRETRTKVKKKYGFVYMITCPEGKRFIGKSKFYFKENVTICGNIKRAGYRAITNAIEEHGMENMKFEKLLTCTKETLTKYHEHFIQEYDTYMPKGYNVESKFDQEIRDRIAKTNASKTVRYGHDGRLLPSCVKYIVNADRTGYGIVGHTRCAKKDFVSKKKDLETLYNDCIAYLAQLELH